MRHVTENGGQKSYLSLEDKPEQGVPAPNHTKLQRHVEVLTGFPEHPVKKIPLLSTGTDHEKLNEEIGDNGIRTVSKWRCLKSAFN